MNTHYHVLSGMRGYMPNNNDYCKTLSEAIADARWWAKSTREDGYRVIGSARNRWYDVGVPKCGEPTDYYMYIEITDCNDSDCRGDA